MTSLDELERLAQEATPGPWEATAKRGKRDGYVRRGDRTVADVRYRNGEADAAYIAALSPDVVLSLIAKARLGEAWARAEAALPEGWRLHLTRRPEGSIIATASNHGGASATSYAQATPEAALDALVSELER